MMPCSVKAIDSDNWSTLGVGDQECTGENEFGNRLDPFRFQAWAIQMKEDAMQVKGSFVWGPSHFERFSRLIACCESMPSFVVEMEKIHIAALHRQNSKYDARLARERSASEVQARVFASWAVLITLATQKLVARSVSAGTSDVPRRWSLLVARVVFHIERNAKRTCKQFQ